MSRQVKTFFPVVAIALTWAALAQEDATPDADAAAAAAEAAEEILQDGAGSAEDQVANDGVLEEAFEDESLDEQTYEDDDDDFVPTEEIPADEPIPFPSNI